MTNPRDGKRCYCVTRHDDRLLIQLILPPDDAVALVARLEDPDSDPDSKPSAFTRGLAASVVKVLNEMAAEDEPKAQVPS